MTRAHLYRPIQDNMGNIRPGAVVRVLEPGTETLIIEPLYLHDAGPDSLTNPFTANSGVVDIYLAEPKRVKLGIRVGFEPEFFTTLDVTLPIDVPPPHSHPLLEALIGHTHPAQTYARTTATMTTEPLAFGQTTTSGTINLARGYRIYAIETSRAARVRLYSTEAQQNADVTRQQGTNPPDDSGVMLEYSTRGSARQSLSPLADGFLDEGSASDIAVPITVTNNDSQPGTVVVTLTYVRTE